MNSTAPLHIIAIGASAGGLDEIKVFFDHTPLDGAAYVIVQHLSVDFKSRMAEIVARHSHLLVKEAQEGLELKTNEVYLIPSDKFMTIKGNKFYLTDKVGEKRPHLTINTFFKSLAQNSGDKAIAVVLSGLGSDGTEGVKAIRAAGGMVMVRNPDNTQFGSMPACALATGSVDFVLEPAQMPAAIMDYTEQQDETAAARAKDKKALAAIIELISAQLPFDFTDYKQATILRRTKRRATQNNFATLEKYLAFLKKNPKEIEALAQDFLISVTAFFRDKEAFAYIEKKVLPELLQKLPPEEELRIWVAGCASGEEAYSLAIQVREQLQATHKKTDVKIFATDIDQSALAIAGQGVYPASNLKEMPEALKEKYFTKEEGQYRIASVIRKMVIFAQHDLVKNPPYCNMHLISCRNLLIYLTPELQRKIYALLLFGLRKEGFLFLGSSESPVVILDKLEVIHKKFKIYQSLEANRGVRFDAFSLPEPLRKKILPQAQENIPFQTQTLSEAVNDQLLQDLGYLVVCIDDKSQVVETFGDTANFLLQKNFTYTLTDLLPRPLAVAFNTLRTEAVKNNAKTSLTGIRINSDTDAQNVCLTVSPMALKKGMPRLYMVTFTFDTTENPVTGQHQVFDEKQQISQYTTNLEQELLEVKEKIHVIQLQIVASNENLQSFNEELLSANEEMQSTNEEMQSINEELQTVNTDYQLKNKELLELNDDLNNYFRSNISGQLFVNNDLLLMKFSPGTVKQINLLPSDLGRPLSNISTNIKFETFTEDIKQVLAQGDVITKEIEALDGKWYQVMTMPYIHQADNSRNGAIITFTDISDLKKAQAELDRKNKSLLRLNADLDNFAHTASHDLLAPLSNIEGSINYINGIENLDPEVADFLGIINSSVKKFRSLITGIGVVAKIENDMLVLEMVDFDDILSNVEWSLDDKIKAENVTIKRDLEVSHVSFSKKNLRSILFNLVANSIKFRGEASPIISIKTRQEEDGIVLSVSDNGMGIPENQLTTIFDLHGRLNSHIEGQGIGLYLAKKIVDATGGKIEVDSKVGQGTTFHLHLKMETHLA